MEFKTQAQNVTLKSSSNSSNLMTAVTTKYFDSISAINQITEQKQIKKLVKFIVIIYLFFIDSSFNHYSLNCILYIGGVKSPYCTWGIFLTYLNLISFILVFDNRWKDARTLWIYFVWEARWDYSGLHNNFVYKLGVSSYISKFVDNMQIYEIIKSDFPLFKLVCRYMTLYPNL